MIVPSTITALYTIAGHVMTENEHKNRHNVGPSGLARKYVRTSTGALERRSPLPVGRYWIDVFEPKKAVWESWVQFARGALRVVSTEHYDSIGGYPSRDWILFEVVTPTEWNVAKDIGWPTIAGPQVESSEDTVEKPEPEPVFKAPSFETKVVVGGAALLIAAVAIGYAARSVR